MSQERLVALRHACHAQPELSGHEAETAARVRAFLAAYAPAEILDGLGGGHGLAAVFAGDDPAGGPTIVLRAELDALPIQEIGRTAYRSNRTGVAHLCGHDGHLAILCGVAPWLRAHELRRGRVVLLAQPAEETGEGARAVAADPRFQALDADWAFALHNLPGYPLGTVLVRDGAFTAGSVGVAIRLMGRTAHAAYPEQGTSPARAMTDLVTGLVTLPIAREARGELALVTVVHARLGEVTFGTSPGEAEVMATLRADHEPVLAGLRDEAAALAHRIAARDGLAVAVEWVEEFPVTVNDARATAHIVAAAGAAGLSLGSPKESPFRWSEDFGWFTRTIPGAMIGLGAGVDHPPLHAPDFDFPDALIAQGVRLWGALIAQVCCS